MKKVGYFALTDDASSFYRLQGVFPFITDKNLELVDISHLNPGSWATIAPFDVIIFQRLFAEDHAALIMQCQIMGRKVIIDYDDNILEVPPHNPAYELYKNKKWSMQCLRLADELWVSTVALAEDFKKYNKNIHVVPNAHNNHMFHVEQKKDFNFENKLVIYRGGNTHRLDLFNKASDLAMLADYHKDWQFQYIGIADNHEFFEMNSRNENVSVTNKIPFIQYMDYLRTMNAPVMINPLLDIPINRSKSNISWIEGCYAGSVLFTNKNLPEFNYAFIGDIGTLINSPHRYLDKDGFDKLSLMHEESWAYIQKNLLLSSVNKLRIQRLLA